MRHAASPSIGCCDDKAPGDRTVSDHPNAGHDGTGRGGGDGHEAVGGGGRGGEGEDRPHARVLHRRRLVSGDGGPGRCGGGGRGRGRATCNVNVNVNTVHVHTLRQRRPTGGGGVNHHARPSVATCKLFTFTSTFTCRPGQTGRPWRGARNRARSRTCLRRRDRT